MKKSVKLICRISAAALAIHMTASGVAAQSTDGQAVAATAQDEGEIVVTASKREEKLRDVPSAITVLDGDALADLGVRSVRDYASLTPGLTIQGDGTPGSGKVFIRGLQTGALQQSATTVYYLDDVPFTASSANGGGAFIAPDPELADLDRIEVLKGPQGTLYGASSLGGVVRLISKRPDASRYSASARAEVTAIDGGGVGYLVNLNANLPLVRDTLAVRATGFYRRAPGFIDNVGTGATDVNESVSKGARLALGWTPNDRLSIDLVGQLQDTDTHGPTLQDNVTGSFTPLYGERKYSAYFNAPSSVRYRLASITGRYDMGIGDLIATAAYLESKLSTDTDITTAYAGTVGVLASLGLPYPANTGVVSESRIPQKKTTAEIRFVSDRLGPVEFIAGGFFTHESVDLDSDVVARSIPDNLPLADPVATLISAPITDRYREVSAFGNLTYYLADNLDVTGGLRFAHYEEDFTLGYSGTVYTIFYGGPVSIPELHAKKDHLAYLATLRWRPTDRLSVFLRAANSFRPGGPQPAAVVPPGAQSQINPDTVWNYEAGVKADFLDGRLSVQASAYRIDWKDIQLYSYVTVAGLRQIVLANAGGAKVDGFEFAVQARPTDKTTLSANLGYTNPRITQIEQGVSDYIGAYAGDTIPQTPKWTASATADHMFDLGGGVQGQLGGTLRYQSHMFTSYPRSIINPNVRVPGYTTVDLRAGVNFGGYQVQLRAENLFDQGGIINYNPGSPGVPAGANLIRPRSFTLALSARF
ncbi:TonB-dependent receptor [Sphingomonas colocasiae]|uniref:TonB-dependent receptor n=2 Tax=Sphingomonas colocasiae TaxID=1848973 RepID=A0ABS7PRV4_9SPHN|nr:TonB-dependent receptor [Sphingomonas colocasiae]